ncbi:DNA polymerase III chi subunit [Stella humosa]|uniref:DNA polymerase III chi subunit n=1 Tax=Stella humosa TaxID=94 RepID=A0A3N1M9N9_9PROT|nr:DNA polymerase III subunit chi [Stella humosa]ROP99509.1 DNA polymerase III chi subunit [Stella humosa]BBK31277.1 DNA polymerase III subunit chi [Stella humosa]
MTDIGFYHLTRTPLERALPRLLEKVAGIGRRAVVLAGSTERVEALNALLWTYDPDSFLPHGSAADGNAPQQPIWLTAADENPNQATVLVLVDGMSSSRLADYERCLDLFDGNDPEAVATARDRWRTAKDAGHKLTYWQQTEQGGWQAKG